MSDSTEKVVVDIVWAVDVDGEETKPNKKQKIEPEKKSHSLVIAVNTGSEEIWNVWQIPDEEISEVERGWLHQLHGNVLDSIDEECEDGLNVLYRLDDDLWSDWDETCMELIVTELHYTAQTELDREMELISVKNKWHKFIIDDKKLPDGSLDCQHLYMFFVNF